MKKLIFFSLFSLLSFHFSFAQTADEIVENYLKTIGGKEKLSKIKAIHIKAKTITQGMEIPVNMFMTADGKQYMEFELQGKKLVQQAFDGKTAWHTNMMNMKNEKFDNETTENFKRNSKDEFPNPFLNYKEKGFKIELIGKEEVEGTETYKIKLTEHPLLVEGKEVSKETYYYFDTENFIPVVVEEEIKKGQFKGAKIQQIYSDYQEVDGIYFPFNTATKFNGMIGSEVKIESMEINPQIDEKMFVFKENKTEAPQVKSQVKEKK